jgi:small-conductance mechanosensitive channel
LRMDETFWEANGDWISAAITLAVAFAVAFLVDRFVIHHALLHARRVSEVTVSRAAATRLRLVRRLVFVVIVGIGLALALSQFHRLDRLATGLLASSAVVGLVVGFAARAVLANPVAGIMLAVTQPIRIGDTITIDEETGQVDDLTLSHTYIDTGDGRLMVVPNEQLATRLLFNRSTGDRTAPARATVWLPSDANLGKARRALRELELSSISVAEITAEGVRVEVQGKRDPTRTVMTGEEAALRESAHEALREAGVLASE